MNNELLEKIKELYSLSVILSTKKIEKGFLSENHKISTNNKNYFLKKYRFAEREKILEVHTVKKYFNAKGIPVIMPLVSKNEETFFKYDDSYFALFPFVSGLQPERGQLSKEMIASLGKMLGHMHLLGKDAPPPVTKTFKAWDKQKSLEIITALEEKLSQIKNKTVFDKLTEKALHFKKKLILAHTETSSDFSLTSDHLVHGDYLDHNVFFNEDGSIKYVFDFEKTGFEPRSQELFRSATYTFLNTDFDSMAIENMRLYLQSYLDVYPMEEKELRDGFMVHYLKSIHDFWVMKEHYLNNNTRVDLFLEPGHKRLQFMTENFDTMLQSFTKSFQHNYK